MSLIGYELTGYLAVLLSADSIATESGASKAELNAMSNFRARTYAPIPDFPLDMLVPPY